MGVSRVMAWVGRTRRWVGLAMKYVWGGGGGGIMNILCIVGIPWHVATIDNLQCMYV